jgi:hypothetical protein
VYDLLNSAANAQPASVNARLLSIALTNHAHATKYATYYIHLGVISINVVHEACFSDDNLQIFNIHKWEKFWSEDRTLQNTTDMYNRA